MELEYRSQKWFAGDAPVNYEKASAQIGAGTNGTVTVIKDTFDVDADDYSIEVVIPEEASDLSATLEDKKITVSLATVEAESASATIGAGTNGAVTVVVDEPGEDGNDFTIAVVEGFDGGTLGAGLNFETDIVVALGMTTASKASTTIGSGGDGVVTVEVDTAGNAGNSKTIEVVVAGEPDAALACTYAGDDLLITLGTGAAGLVDDAKNTATLIAGIVNSQAGSTFTATASGTGDTAISEAVTKKSFDGGADTAPDNAQNTATLIASAINELDGFTATASGSGVTPITGAIAEAEFTGGSDVALNGSANTATLVAAEISEIDGFVATASGNGTTALSTETEEDVDFADGAYGTPCPQAGVTLYIGGYYYVSTKADNTVCNDGWRRFTLASY